MSGPVRHTEIKERLIEEDAKVQEVHKTIRGR